MANLISSLLGNSRPRIFSVKPDVSVYECSELMSSNNIGSLLVMDNEKLTGIVSERDIVRNCVHKKLDPDNLTAGDIAYTQVSILTLHDPVEKAMKIMTETRQRYVLIQEKGNIIALLSIGDIMYHLLEDKIRVIEQLEHYIHS